MAFIFQVDERGHTRPTIRCDSCQGVIENYADGFVTFDALGATPGAVVQPVFHCAGCEEEAKKAGTSRHPMSIDHFMLSVLNNIHLTPGALEVAGRKLREATSL
jgi:hypothetical protein